MDQNKKQSKPASKKNPQNAGHALGDLAAKQVLPDRTEAAEAPGDEHLTLAEAEHFRTCRISDPEDFAFLRAVNAHLMTCASCRKLVQSVSDLGDALDAAEKE